VAVVMNFAHLDPIKALFWTAVINGVIAVPLMVVMMLMTTNRQVMGQFTLSPGLRTFGWLATAIMLAASLGLFFSSGS
jgi:Mn2+/Fe2+ NRAMP family transporter